ncbi:MAG: hypothetical protein HYY22_02925 [Thaumarchaeota archaeon]|nr:hypothetical protein [Nitrososphaerota archaeon]
MAAQVTSWSVFSPQVQEPHACTYLHPASLQNILVGSRRIDIIENKYLQEI